MGFWQNLMVFGRFRGAGTANWLIRACAGTILSLARIVRASDGTDQRVAGTIPASDRMIPATCPIVSAIAGIVLRRAGTAPASDRTIPAIVPTVPARGGAIRATAGINRERNRTIPASDRIEPS